MRAPDFRLSPEVRFHPRAGRSRLPLLFRRNCFGRRTAWLFPDRNTRAVPISFALPEFVYTPGIFVRLAGWRPGAHNRGFGESRRGRDAPSASSGQALATAGGTPALRTTAFGLRLTALRMPNFFEELFSPPGFLSGVNYRSLFPPRTVPNDFSARRFHA